MTNKQMTMNNLGDDTRFSNEEPMENPETQQELIAALHESNRKLHTLIDSLPGFVYRTKNSSNGTVEYMSEGCFSLTGYKSEAFVNGHVILTQLILKEDAEAISDDVQLAIANKQSFLVEYRITHKNGTIRYCREKGQGIYDSDNNIIALEGFVQDITEQKETEQKLKVKEVQKKAILETLPDLVILYDKHGNHLEIHAPSSFQLVASYKEHIGKNIDAILPKKVCEKIRMGFANCEKTKEIQMVEYALIIDDKLRQLESRITQTETGDFLTVIRDVTESKDAEKIITENAQRLKLSLEVGELGSWEWNLVTNKIVRDENQNLLFGAKAKEDTVTYQSYLENIHSEDREKVKLEVSKAIKNESSYTLDYRIVHPDTSVHWLHEKGKIFKNSKGIPLRVIGVTHDITTQKIAEQKLKEDEEALRDYAVKLENKVDERTKELTNAVQKLVASNLSLEDQILVTKQAETEALSSKLLVDNIAQNFPRGFVAVVNTDFEIVFLEGEELEELGFKGLTKMKTTINEVVNLSEDVKIKLIDNVQKTFKGTHCSFEIKLFNTYYTVNTTPLFDDNNKITEVLLIHNNITDQKQIEINITNNLEKEKELSQLKSRFISMASHEFRTPLSAILTSAILIEKLNTSGKEEKRLNHVSKIKNNVKNLVVILNDFLSLSKLQEGKVIVQPSLFDLIDFSKSVIEELDDIKKSGQLITFKHQQPNLEVFLDVKLMRHIVFNLLSNAIKYSEENKSITFKIETTNQQLLIEIKDEGIGIPKEDLDHMFQRFYRANNTTNIQGTGLGLNIVKQYTELMGGNITFNSELNVGTTFYIKFPLNTEKDEKNIINRG